MEHGTDCEREAVRDRWAELERQRVRSTRLLGGVTLALGGALAVVIGLAGEACSGDAGVPYRCVEVTPNPVASVLVLVGGLALVAGLYRCWSSLSE